MTGDIHLEGDALERFLDLATSRDEDLALLEHLGGGCARCTNALGRVKQKRFRRSIVRRIERACEHDGFAAVLRRLLKPRRGHLAGAHRRILGLWDTEGRSS